MDVGGGLYIYNQIWKDNKISSWLNIKEYGSSLFGVCGGPEKGRLVCVNDYSLKHTILWLHVQTQFPSCKSPW